VTRVGVVDYGVGNLRSVTNALLHLGARPVVSGQASELERCDRLVLPGVGAFPHGMEALRLRGLDDFVRGWAAGGRPLLGICLGMQLFLDASSEFGETPGLGILPGRVDALQDLTSPQVPLRLPHVGWAALQPGGAPAPGLFDGVLPQATFYFVHSYACRAEHPACAATAGYAGVRFAACLRRDQVLGVQFHPEKSGPSGLRFLCNFLEMP
jgi:glutamine amidotransferase